MNSPDFVESSSELRKGYRSCAHFVLKPTTLQLIPHYSSSFWESAGNPCSRWPERCPMSLSELE